MSEQPAILIVSDSDAEVAAWLAAWLVSQPWPVIWHLDASAALRGILQRSPRLVLVDVTRPDALPPRLALIAEAHDRRPRVKLAAYAAQAEQAVERAVRAAGADLYLVDAADLPAIESILADTGPPPARRPPIPRIRGRPPDHALNPSFPDLYSIAPDTPEDLP